MRPQSRDQHQVIRPRSQALARSRLPGPLRFLIGHRERIKGYLRWLVRCRLLPHPGIEAPAPSRLEPRVALLLSEGGRVRLGRDVEIARGATIASRGRLAIGDHTFIGHYSTISCVQALTIGEYCLIAEQVSIRDHDHEFADPAAPIQRQGLRCKPVRIGNDVWLAAKVTVTAGITIGDGAVVGANSVVTQDVPPYAIVAGAPARVVGHRGPRPEETR